MAPVKKNIPVVETVEDEAPKAPTAVGIDRISEEKECMYAEESPFPLHGTKRAYTDDDEWKAAIAFTKTRLNSFGFMYNKVLRMSATPLCQPEVTPVATGKEGPTTPTNDMKLPAKSTPSPVIATASLQNATTPSTDPIESPTTAPATTPSSAPTKAAKKPCTETPQIATTPSPNAAAKEPAKPTPSPPVTTNSRQNATTPAQKKLAHKSSGGPAPRLGPSRLEVLLSQLRPLPVGNNSLTDGTFESDLMKLLNLWDEVLLFDVPQWVIDACKPEGQLGPVQDVHKECRLKTRLNKSLHRLFAVSLFPAFFGYGDTAHTGTKLPKDSKLGHLGKVLSGFQEKGIFEHNCDAVLLAMEYALEVILPKVKGKNEFVSPVTKDNLLKTSIGGVGKTLKEKRTHDAGKPMWSFAKMEEIGPDCITREYTPWGECSEMTLLLDVVLDGFCDAALNGVLVDHSHLTEDQKATAFEVNNGRRWYKEVILAPTKIGRR